MATAQQMRTAAGLKSLTGIMQRTKKRAAASPAAKKRSRNLKPGKKARVRRARSKIR